MKNRERILEYMLVNPGTPVAKITAALGLSSNSITQHHLVRLRIDGLLPPAVQRGLKYTKAPILETLKKRIEYLEEYIHEMGSYSDTCVYHAIKRKCHGCQCKRFKEIAHLC